MFVLLLLVFVVMLQALLKIHLPIKSPVKQKKLQKEQLKNHLQLLFLRNKYLLLKKQLKKHQRDKLAQTKNEFNDYEQLHQDFVQKRAALNRQKKDLAVLQKQEQDLHDLQKEMGNYQTLLDLQKQVKDIDFNGQNYQKAQDIMAQGRNLQKTIQSVEAQLQDLGENDQSDFTLEKKLIQQKPQLLQWQAEYRNCLELRQRIFKCRSYNV